MNVSSIAVVDMVGRYIESPSGARFLILDARYDARLDQVVFVLADAYAPDDEETVTSLAGWTLL